MRRAIFSRIGRAGDGSGDVERFYAIMGSGGAVVAKITNGRPAGVTIHEVAESDTEETCDSCEFVDNRPCYPLTFGIDGPASYELERRALDRIGVGDWGPLLTIYAERFAPVEELEPVPGVIVTV